MMSETDSFSGFSEVTGTFHVHPDLNRRTLGAVIKKVRTDKEMTLQELGDKVGCTHVFLSRVESGQKFPSEKLLEKIQKALGIRQIVTTRGAGHIESSSLADLIHPELWGLVLSAAQKKLARLIVSTLRKAGEKPEVRSPSSTEWEQGIRAVIEVPGADNHRFNITMTDGNG